MGLCREDAIMELKRSGREAGNSWSRKRISRVDLGSLGKFGCVLGALVGLVPSLVSVWAGVLVVRGLRRLLETWQGASFRIVGQEIVIDVISLLNLAPILHRLQQIDDLSWGLVVLAVMAGSLLAGVSFLAMASGLGGVYNLIARLTGGLEVELRDVEPSRDGKR
jgi:hypothetical protein